MARKGEQTQFWKLAWSGETKKDRNGGRFWELRLDISNDDWHLLNRGGTRISKFNRPVSARADRVSDKEDMPWTADLVLIVSERLRSLWESMYPGNVQYIPLSLTLRGKKQIEGYYIANLLKIVNCLDRKATIAKWGPGPMVRQEVNPKRVPKRVGIFRMKGFPSEFIREDVRAAMKAHKITGWFEYTP